MALVRLIVGVGAVVLFMPTDKETQTKVYDATANAVERVATFCTRNPETCQKGGEYWAVFKQKAEFGARMAWSLAVERMNKGETAKTAEAKSPGREIVTGTTVDRGTLTDRDLLPHWRSSAARKAN